MISKFSKILKQNVSQITLLMMFSFIFVNLLGFILQGKLEDTILNFYLMIFQQLFFIFSIKYLFNRQIISSQTMYTKNLRPTQYIKGVLQGFGCLFVFGIILSIIQQQINLYGFMQQADIFEFFPKEIFKKSILIFIACVVAPITEELIFRGALLGSLLQKLPKNKAIITSSILFSLLHFQPEVAGSIFVISLIISWLYLKYESIYLSILFHIVNNTLKTLITL